MENLDIQPTASTPQVSFNAETGRLLMKGRSIPEDPGEFFDRIFRWLEQYFSETDRETELEFRIEYANSGSSKYILEILKDVQNYTTGGKNIRVIWCYEADDESIEELGELYKNALDLTFEMREIEEEDEEDDF